MDRAYLSGASGSAPSAPASPSTGYPTAGNTGTGTEATKPGPYWYHMIMEELMAVISAAGITPSQGNLTQLLMALTELMPQFSDQTGLLSANGWVSIPLKIEGVKRKLIIQWGAVTNTANATSSGTFPIQFPNASFGVVITGLQGTGNTQAYAVLNSHNQIGFTWNAFFATGGSAPVLGTVSGNVQGRFIAVGW